MSAELVEEVVAPAAGQLPDPLALALRWAHHLAAGDLDAVTDSYAPGAVLHADGIVHTGGSQIRSYWSTSSLLRGTPVRVVEEVPSGIRLRWPTDGAERFVESKLVVQDGRIVEQWHGHVTVIADVTVPVVEVLSSERVEREERAAVLQCVLDAVGSLEHVDRLQLTVERAASGGGNPAPLRAQVALHATWGSIHTAAVGARAGDVGLRLRRQISSGLAFP